jgi:Uma2 family endonuclease
MMSTATALPSIYQRSNSSAEIDDKRLECFNAGVKLVWVVHPIPRTIHVYSSPGDCRMFTADGTLDGGAAIPGFQVKVADVFACIFPAPANPTNGTP